jgi:hypothetical protein
MSPDMVIDFGNEAPQLLLRGESDGAGETKGGEQPEQEEDEEEDDEDDEEEESGFQAQGGGSVSLAEPAPRRRTVISRSIYRSGDAPLKAYQRGDELFLPDGSKYPAAEFVCADTGVSLVGQDFLFREGRLYSLDAFHTRFGADNCAACFTPLGTGMVLKAKNYTFHATCFRCCHTGKDLGDGQPYIIHQGKLFSKESYLELFHSCTLCSTAVPLQQDACSDESLRGIKALDGLWHVRCFKCHSCSTPLVDKSFHGEARQVRTVLMWPLLIAID